MRAQTKVIVVAILISLLSVFGYQLFWLINFYDGQYKEMEMAITNAMRNVGFKGVVLRNVNPANITSNTYNVGLNSKSSDSLSLSQASFPYILDDTMNEIMKDSSIRCIIGKAGVNLNTSEMKRAGFSLFHSLLQSELKHMDINIPFYLEHVNCVKDSVLSRYPSAFTDSNDKHYKKYHLQLSSEKDEAYNLYLYKPKWHLFRDMWGLVLVSLLMIGLLIASYIYLLKIIWQQKNIDEIKSDFINNMTHELKTPIAVAYAAMESLQNTRIGDNEERRDEYIAMSKNQLMNLNHLVEQILHSSVEEKSYMKLKFENIAVYEVFESIKRQFAQKANKNIEFEINVDPVNLHIVADKTHFRSIVSNLVENSIKYSKDSVKITLSAVKHKQKIKIFIKDDGIGIEQSALSKIYDKFYRVPTGNRHDAKGYGLGLYYVKTAVDKHGWAIDVGNNLDSDGCNFKITINDD